MSEGRRDRLGTPASEQPDGSLSSIVYEYHICVAAASTHCRHEGIQPDVEAVLDSYDRALHPWMHGRRPHDLARRARRWWPW